MLADFHPDRMTAIRDVLAIYEKLPVTRKTLVMRAAVLVDQVLHEHDSSRLAHHEGTSARVPIGAKLENSSLSLPELPAGMREHPEHPPGLQLREQLLAVTEGHVLPLQGHSRGPIRLARDASIGLPTCTQFIRLGVVWDRRVTGEAGSALVRHPIRTTVRRGAEGTTGGSIDTELPGEQKPAIHTRQLMTWFGLGVVCFAEGHSAPKGETAAL